MKWEYCVVVVEDDALEMAKILNFAGAAGWELVAVTAALVGPYLRLFLKQRMPPPPPAGEVR